MCAESADDHRRARECFITRHAGDQDGTAAGSNGIRSNTLIQKVIFAASCMIRSPAVAVGRPNNVPRVNVVPATL
jgi:hypothetical protein